MQCLQKYQWVKLPRCHLPEGKGIMSKWARLASRAAFRKGTVTYCGHRNPVAPGMWSGGIVGLKSILGLRSRVKALETLQVLSDLGYVHYELNAKTKQLTYEITDWVVKCSGAECMDGVVYATDGYGFLCLPRSITERLAEQHYTFEESDAWLDLWCHTVSNDPRNRLFFFNSCCPVWEIWRHFDFGNPGKALGLGKDKGMEILSEAWGCFLSAPSARFLWLSHF